MENNLEIIEVSTYQKNVVFEKTINFELNDIDYEYSYLQTDENLYINIVDEEVGLDILAIHNDEKYVNKLIVDEDLFNLFKENNMIDKNENYNDFKDLSKEIVVLEFNGHNDLVFEKKKNIVGSGVDVIHYNNKLFDEDFFKALKNNDITSNLFGDKDYKQFCENSIDVANDKESVDLER